MVRVKTYITANEGFARRTLDYLSFMAGRLPRRPGAAPRPDLIVGTSPQFFTVCAAWVLARARRRPWVFELRDLWPASIKAVGAMPGRAPFILALEALECGSTAPRTPPSSPSPRPSAAELDPSAASMPPRSTPLSTGVDLDRFYPRPEAGPDLLRDLDLEGRLRGGLHRHPGRWPMPCIWSWRRRTCCAGAREIVFLFVGSGAAHQALVDLAQAPWPAQRPLRRAPGRRTRCRATGPCAT